MTKTRQARPATPKRTAEELYADETKGWKSFPRKISKRQAKQEWSEACATFWFRICTRLAAWTAEKSPAKRQLFDLETEIEAWEEYIAEQIFADEGYAETRKQGSFMLLF